MVVVESPVTVVGSWVRFFFIICPLLLLVRVCYFHRYSDLKPRNRRSALGNAMQGEALMQLVE